jgi:pimeloyl-ACP methyl ester carboxylesterase
MLDTMTVIELAIPYEQPGYDNEIKLPGYLYLPLERNRLVDRPKTPIVINLNGGDSIQEELFFICPSLGPQLGYAVLTFDGPGQGSVLRKQAIGMRPDWEMVIRQVVDWLSEFSDTSEGSKHHLDLDQIAIVGASMGGYFALRGARDSRVKACVSIDAPYDMWDLATAKLPKWFLHGWNSGLISNSVVDFIVALVSRVNFQLKWEVEHMKWAFGTDTASTALKRLQEYSFRLPDGSEFLEDVHCACLITGAGSSLYFDIEQSTMKIFNALKNINENMKEVWIAKHPNEGGLQAKVGAFSVSNQRTFAFLDRCFSIKRLPIEVMTDC